ncbi:hypothetical protein DPEC_G00134970 [Dallia pectoralis]|uniref:Uncharacterized protein n=1 Tax=Dallia pectoralis TaxID=75939 RepID=A0ACC2GRZ5_DALPE|nr:hypothetical protein DPEC_G00134970 [Dallia pectoralis]
MRLSVSSCQWSRASSCISTLQTSRQPGPSTFSELKDFCYSTNEAQFSRLGGTELGHSSALAHWLELGLDELLRHCKSWLRSSLPQRNDPCYPGHGRDGPLPHTAFDMLQTLAASLAGGTWSVLSGGQVVRDFLREKPHLPWRNCSSWHTWQCLPDAQLQQTGKRLAQRVNLAKTLHQMHCLHKLLTSPAAVPISDLQLAAVAFDGAGGSHVEIVVGEGRMGLEIAEPEILARPLAGSLEVHEENISSVSDSG